MTNEFEIAYEKQDTHNKNDFRAGWIAALKAMIERRHVCPSCGDAIDCNLADELIDAARCDCLEF